MQLSDQELFKLHVEAVWDVTLSCSDDAHFEVVAAGPQPAWSLYLGHLKTELVFVWRADVSRAQREHLRALASSGIEQFSEYTVRQERAFVHTGQARMSLAAAAALARPLTPTDYALMEASETGRGEHLLQSHCAPVFGVVIAEQLLSVAHSARQTPHACELGLETHPQARRQGFALAATLLWTQAVTAQGLLPFYSALAENTASLKLAESAGYQEFVRGTTVRTHSIYS